MAIENVKLKRILVVVTIIILAVTMVACNYKPATDSGNNNVNENGGSSSGGNGSSDDAGTSGDLFTVKLTSKENIPAAYIITLKAIWTDIESLNGAFYSASFDKDGVATVSGLDGDYRVTLSALPEGYTYNPNIYFVSNDSRDVEIALYKLSKPTNENTATGAVNPASPKDPGNFYQLSSTGAYRAVLTEDNFEAGVWYTYKPTTAGTYSVESLIDITANKLNPILDQHGGSFAMVDSDNATTIDGGGEGSTYTKNFRYEIEIEPNKLGNVYHFRIYATTLDKGVFPIDVDFILERDGDVTGTGSQKAETVSVTHDFDALDSSVFDEVSDGQFEAYAKYDGHNNVLDGNNIYYAGDEATTEEDKKRLDYYYYLDSNGNKKVLFVQISVDNIAFATETEKGFTDYKNRPKYIEGKDDDGNTHYYYYVDFISTYNEHSQNGCYPLTKELKLFLQRFSKARGLFDDGDGIAEKNGKNSLSSSESNQYLFACGVYRAKEQK